MGSPASLAPIASARTTASSRDGGRSAGRTCAATFTFHADPRSRSARTFGLDGLEVTWNVFQAWKQFQQDGDRDALRQRVAAIKAQMRPLLEWGSTGKRQRHVRALAKNLLKLWPAIWTFADIRDVEPTNYAEQRGRRA